MIFARVFTKYPVVIGPAMTAHGSLDPVIKKSLKTPLLLRDGRNPGRYYRYGHFA
jgi:hypothetical protein